MKHINFSIEFISDWHIGSGHGRHGHLDRTYDRDERGLPFLGAKSLKGVLRTSMELIATGLDNGTSGSWNQLMRWVLGSQPTVDAATGVRPSPQPGALIVDRATIGDGVAGTLARRPGLRRALTVERPGVMLDDLGVALDNHLRFVEMAPSGLVLHGRCSLPDSAPDAAEALVVAALQNISWVGHRRRRGWGRCTVSVHGTHPGFEVLDGEAPAPPPVLGVGPAPSATDSNQPADDGRWLSYRCTVRALSPLLLPAMRSGNDVSSRSTIPGSSMLALLGALAPNAVHTGVRNGSLRAGEGVPLIDGQSALPVPLSWFRPKEGLDGAAVPLVNRLSGAPTGSDQQVQVRRGFVAPGSSPGTALIGETVSERRIHVSIDDSTLAAQDGALFSYSAIVPGTGFSITLVLTEACASAIAAEAGRASVDEVLRGEHRMGASRRNDYGRVVVESVESEAWGTPAAGDTVQGEFTVWLTSDMLALDDRLNPCPTADGVAAELTRALNTSVEVLRSFTRRARRDSWHGVWGLPRPSLVGLAAGSVVVCRTADRSPVSAAVLQRLGRLGIGDRTAEGFGRFVVDDPLISAGTANRAGSTMAPARTTATASDADQTVIRSLERRAWQLFINERVAVAIAARAHSTKLHLNSEKPGASQLGGLRAAARSDAGALAELKDWWEAMKSVENRRKRWAPEAVTAIDGLLATPGSVWEVLGVGNDQLAALAGSDEQVRSARERYAPAAVAAFIASAARAAQRDQAGRANGEEL